MAQYFGVFSAAGDGLGLHGDLAGFLAGLALFGLGVDALVLGVGVDGDFALGALVGVLPAGGDGGVVLAVGDAETVLVTVLAGDADGRHGLTTGGGGFADLDEQEATVLDGADGDELVGQPGQQVGVGLADLVQMRYHLVRQRGPDDGLQPMRPGQ